MFKLLKVSKAHANKGIYHTRKNGDFVQELFRRDADLIYEVTEQNDDFGQEYAFFIIEVENGDILRYDKCEHHLRTRCYFNEQEVYRDSCEISEMCHQCIEQGKALPEKLGNLLKDNLSVFFSRIIKWETRGFDSNSVWQNYRWILEYLGKNANEYVSQNIIDKFIKQLNIEHELGQFERIRESQAIDFHPENIKGYLRAKEELEDTIEIAKELISQKKYSDIKWGNSDNLHFSAYAKTPCGSIGIYVDFKFGFTVKLVMDNKMKSCRNTTVDITEQCKELAVNFEK